MDKFKNFNIDFNHQFSKYQANYFTENLNTKIKQLWQSNENKDFESRNNLIQRLSKIFLEYDVDVKAIRTSRSTGLRSNTKDMLMKVV